MRLFKLSLSLPSFYGHGDEPVREALRKQFDQFAKSKISEIDGLTVARWDSESWFSRGYEVVVDEKAFASVHFMGKQIFQLGDYPENLPKDGFSVDNIEKIYDGADPYGPLRNILERLELAAHRLEAVDGQTVDYPGVWNNKTTSPLSGTHLVNVNDLMLLQDACTDELQNTLDQGWRLIAVCPQEQRRPDYVLGRVNPAYSPRGQALRHAEN